uniref:Phorbol-ester/DAG-type domain-containing protein n=1 Tax=Caenorhabditis japonica TaxID=281687 RepID=A0A8R1DGC1_CAEJA
MDSTKKKTPRRRALSPKQSPYASPFQVIDLNADMDLKSRLLESESIIEDLRVERDQLQGQLIDQSGLNESVIIQTSNRVSTQETRIFTRNMTVLEDELNQKRAEIGRLNAKVSNMEMEAERMSEKLRTTEEEMTEKDRIVEALRARIHSMGKQVLQKTIEIGEMGGTLQLQKLEMSEQKTEMDNRIQQFQSKIASLLAKSDAVVEEKQILEQRCENLLAEVERLQLELQDKDEKVRITSESLENRLRSSMENTNTQKVLSEVRQLSDRLESLTPVRKVTDSVRREREEYLQLSAKVIDEILGDLKRKNALLEQQLTEKTELVKSTKEELEELKKSMKERMGDAEQATKYLHDERLKISQLTRQKADIRCDLLLAQRQLQEFATQREKLEKQRDDALEDVARIREKKQLVEEELRALKALNVEKNDEMEEMNARLAGFDGLKVEHEVLKGELSRSLDKIKQMGKCLAMADQQCENFKTAELAAQRSRRRAIKQCNDMVAKIKNLQTSVQNQRKLEVEILDLRAQNDRQTAKLQFMQEEIHELHVDYRQELSKITEKSGTVEEKEEIRLKLSHTESQLRSATKTIEELRVDAAGIQKALEEMHAKQENILEENVRLRKGMSDALAKIEEYKRLWENEKEQRERIEQEAKQAYEKLSELESELQEKSQRVLESDETISYLHSQINTKHQKQALLGRRSALLSTVSKLDTSVYKREAEEVQQLEEERQKLLRSLSTERRILADSKSVSTGNTTTIIQDTVVTSQTSQSTSELKTPAASTTGCGIMRHDIPHVWREMRHLGVFSIKCSLCFDAIPTLHKVKKCAHCDVHVHYTCAPRVANTCGMPVACATFYQQNWSGAAPGGADGTKMNGWMRVYRDNVPGSTWISAWAMMDLCAISFYTNDGIDLASPFFSIDLQKEQWVLRTGQQMPIELPIKDKAVGAAATNVLMIKMPRGSVYILAASQPSAQRWAQCLATAQRKRMMLMAARQKKKTGGTSLMADYSCLLVLNSPNNLRIFRAHTIEDWIVFATATGLFFTSISSPRAPIRIAGPSSVTWLEIMAEVNCIAMVVNSNSQLALIPMDTFSLAIQSTQPSIRPEKLPVPEPVTFIESAPSGIIFSSDTFYYVPFSTSASSISDIRARPLRPPKSCDFPISALVMSQSEMLLAYQNYGCFVDFEGNQTRAATIEWEKMPLEFTYTSPHLYIVHDDSIEILEVLAASESTATENFAPDREVFECVNAHVIGRQFEGVLISVSSSESTEVHRFSCSPQRLNVSTKH